MEDQSLCRHGGSDGRGLLKVVRSITMHCLVSLHCDLEASIYSAVTDRTFRQPNVGVEVLVDSLSKQWLCCAEWRGNTMITKYPGACLQTTPCIRQNSLYALHWWSRSQRGLVVAGLRWNEQWHERHIAMAAQVWSLAVRQIESCSSQYVLK